jgi:hypothetical protein
MDKKLAASNTEDEIFSGGKEANDENRNKSNLTK